MREQTIPVFYDEKSYASTQYSNAIQGIRTAAGRCGMRVELISDAAAPGTDVSALPPAAIVTGASMPFMQQTIARLRENKRLAVLCGTDSEQFGHDVSCATPSRRTETQQLVNYLHNCGRERIALVGFGKNSINDNFRYHAAMSAVAVWGRPLTDEDVWLWQHDPRESFEQFLDICDRYDTVICPNDIMAICFINCCKGRGVRVPEDLFVASFGNMSIGRYYKPTITSMTMDMLCVGEQAFNVWRFLIANESAQQMALKITVPSRILARESTACMNIEVGEGQITPPLQADRFYYNPTIAMLGSIDNCISQRDPIDMRIISALMDEHSYEQISGDLFISGSTLRYRLNKIFADAGAHSRQEFESLVRTHLGEGNPFAFVD